MVRPGTEPGIAANCPARFTCPLSDDIRLALGAREGLLASGDIFVDRREDLDRILSLYPDALAVDMESAAIAHACHLRNIPFVCLRVISDTREREETPLHTTISGLPLPKPHSTLSNVSLSCSE